MFPFKICRKGDLQEWYKDWDATEPSAWPDGPVSGFVARGGFEMNITWKDHKLVEAVIHSRLGNPCVLIYNRREIPVSIKAGESYCLE